MTEQLLFELVSPEKLLISKMVALVTVPGGEGDYGVLLGHAPMITTIRPGIIDVYEQSDASLTERIFVGGGFAEVTGERCTVLAEDATPIKEIDTISVSERIKKLTEDFTVAETDLDRVLIETQLIAQRAKLDAAAAV